MVRVLFDHNMPPRLAKALDILVRIDGHEAIPLRDKFDIKIDDVDYFSVLGKEGDWVVISKDLANARRKPERQAILDSGLTAFYFSPALAAMPISQQGALILWHWDAILRFKSENKAGLYQLPINKGSKFRRL